MIIDVRNIESGLKRFKLSKKNVELVKGMIDKQLFLYKHLKLDPSNVSLVIFSNETGEIESIRVFEQNNIPIENLDLSYEKSKKYSVFDESKIDFVFWVSFYDNGETISIVRGKLSDMANLKYRKAKNVTYGITDGNEVLKIDISQQDVKGTEYDVLKKAVAYTFKKRTGRVSDSLNCVAIMYT